MKKISLSLEDNAYWEAKKVIPSGKISSLTSKLLKEHLRKIKMERLRASYKKTVKSKAIKEEDKVWDEAIADGIDK